MDITITKNMSAEEMNRLVKEFCEKKEEQQQQRKSEALKKASGILKKLDKPVETIMKEIREGWL